MSEARVHVTLVHVDIDCGFMNPVIAFTIVLTALVFGCWMAGALLSRRPVWQRGVHFTGVLVLGLVGSEAAQALARSTMTGDAGSSTSERVQVGCMNQAPVLLTPAAALLVALVLVLLGLLSRRRGTRPPP